MNLEPTVTAGSLLSRLAIVLLVSALLGVLLYGLQLTIEGLTGSSVKKFSLVVFFVFAGGFAWDTVKHVATLPEGQYLTFRARVGKSLGWFVVYVAAGVLVQLLLGAWAGPWTITIVAWALLALFAGYRAIVGMGSALDEAIK